MTPAELNLQPGDCLLYSPKGMFGWLISIKTWHQVAHCECYVGEGYSVASRDGKGVDSYPFRESELLCVLRPRVPFDLITALAWYVKSSRGQGYDWLGLLRFAWRSEISQTKENNKQFCSEFLTRFYRAGGFDPFNGDDADAIAPFQFRSNPLFDVIYTNKEG